MRFKDKVAIVTGGTSGMGEAAVLGFVNEGASVVINDINEERLKNISEKIQSMGGKVTTSLGDITKTESVNAMVEKTIEEYGKIDILFNYVGGDPALSGLSPFLEQSEDFWDGMIDLNLRSTIIVTWAVLKHMVKKNYGKIINTGAIAGKVGGPGMVLYSAVKGGIIAFTKAVAQEMAPHSINVNCVCPGPVLTPGFEKLFEGRSYEESAEVTALKRVGTPDEVASAVLYLASDDAAFITGQAVSVDGGATMI